MRVAFVGGTGPVGLATVPLLVAAGHDVAVAHSGAHEHESVAGLEHLHGSRDELLAPGGAVERFAPEAIVDTFAGGATAGKGRELAGLATRAGVERIVAVSSMDVYQHCVDAGLGDGSGATELPRFALPLAEDAALRTAPYPGATPGHDNVAMEAALREAGAPACLLRPGTIYGPHPEPHPHLLREWALVGKVHRGEHRLELPDGGTQLFHRVALERVARAIVAALARPPRGPWACNVADPQDRTFGGLAALVAERLGWSWEPERVPWPQGDHPWNVRHPVLCDTGRLRERLGVTEPDPLVATLATIDWLWERREELGQSPSERASSTSRRTPKPVPPFGA